MFTNELTPIWQEFSQHPISFLGGLASGIFRLNLADEPVKGWLEKQSGSLSYGASTSGGNNGKSTGPQSIEIE